MSATNVMLQVKCTNPDCQKVFKMAQPSKGGIYQVVCPVCHSAIKVRVPDNLTQELPANPPVQEPSAPALAKTQAISFGEDTQRHPGRVEIVRKFWKNIPYDLKLGENIIGREDEEQPSDISIAGDMGISRRSICINMSLDEQGYHFILSVLKTKNPVMWNSSLLSEGDEISLKYGDIIVLGGTTLKFKSKNQK